MVAPRKVNREITVPAICARLAVGEPLSVILREVGVARRTVDGWREQDADIARQFDEARDLGHDAIAVGMRETARGRGDSTGDVQRDKLIIDTDDKLLRKWDPRRYGDALKLSGDKENPIMGMTDAQVDARLAVLLAKREASA